MREGRKERREGGKERGGEERRNKRTHDDSGGREGGGVMESEGLLGVHTIIGCPRDGYVQTRCIADIERNGQRLLKVPPQLILFEQGVDNGVNGVIPRLDLTVGQKGADGKGNSRGMRPRVNV